MNGLKYEEQVINHVPASAVSANDVLVIGDVVAVAVNAIAANATGAVRIKGVIKVSKASGEAWTAGQTVYYNASNDNFTTTATGATRAGCAELAAASAATIAPVILNAPASADLGVQSAHIADPAATAADPDALTVSAPAACADMTTDLTGVDTGTDMTAAQAAQIVADLAALKTAIDANNAAVDELIADVTSIRTQLVAGIDDIQANNTAIDSILAALEAFKVTAAS